MNERLQDPQMRINPSIGSFSIKGGPLSMMGKNPFR